MRQAFVNLRFILFSLLVVGLVAAALAGWSYYRNRPEVLMKSALAYAAQGDEARAGNNLPKARDAYEAAERQLQTLLKKEPANTAASLTLWRVLTPLSRVEATLEAQANTPEDQRKANQTATRAIQAVAEAAARNPKAPEPFAILLDFYHKREEYDTAAGHAKALMAALPDNPEAAPALDQADNYMVAAFYLLARDALHAQPARPDDVLDFARKGIAWEKKAAGKSDKGEVSGVPRWRTINLEARALKLKSDLSKKSQTPGGKPRPDTALAALNEPDRMPRWIERARQELAQTTPATPERPAQPVVAALSSTNAAGLLDTLLVGVETAPTRDEATDRANLLLQVSEAMATAAGTQPAVVREAAQASGKLLTLLPRLPRSILPVEAEIQSLSRRVEALNSKALEGGEKSIDLPTYLAMTQTAVQSGRLEQAQDLADRGLKAAAERKQDLIPEAMQLRAEAAWAALLQRKPRQADKYLAELDKSKLLQPTADFLRGLGAVLDGRLEEGTRRLERAQKNPRYANRAALLMGLAHGYMGQGRLDEALPVLTKLQSVYDGKTKLDPGDQSFRDEWLPHGNDIALDRFRCHLALAVRDSRDPATGQVNSEAQARRQQHFQAAEKLRTELAGTPVGPTADSLYIAALTADAAARRRAAAAAAKPGDAAQHLKQARALMDRAREVLDRQPRAVQDDLRLVWADLNLILNQPEVNPRVVASAAFLPLGAGGDIGVLAVEAARARQGLAWQWQKAEDRLKQIALTQKDSLTAQMAWVRWLQSNGRADQAIAYLGELEDQAKADGRTSDQERLQLFRNSLELSRRGATPQEAEAILQSLPGGNNPVLEADLLRIQAMALKGAKSQDILAQIAKARGRHEESGQLYLLEGRLYMLGTRSAEGKPVVVDYGAAIGAFERALEFSNVRGAARNGLLNAVLRLSAQKPELDKDGKPIKETAGPVLAFKEATRLVKAHPDDPAVLLAYAITARLTDHIYSTRPVKAGAAKPAPAGEVPDSMEGALARLKDVLGRVGQGQGAALVAASQWREAGRPDLARKELVPDPTQLPTDPAVLALATGLAVTEEDWPVAAGLLDALGRAQPDNPQVLIGRAALARARGQTDEARKHYQDLIRKRPDLGSGYLGLAALEENAKNYDAARKHLDAWRQKEPDDLAVYRATVRLLARSGQGAKVDAFAEAFLKEQEKAMARKFDDVAEAQDLAIEDKDVLARVQKDRPQAREDALNAARMAVTLETASALQEAGAWDAARAWLTGPGRARDLIQKLPEATRENNRKVLDMVLASIALEQSKTEKDRKRREALVQEAEGLYSKILAQDPHNMVAVNNKAWLLATEDRDAKTAAALLDGLRQSPFGEGQISGERMPLELLDTFGVVYRGAGRYDQAAELFQQALQRYSNEPRVLLHLARALKAVRKTDEAYQACKDALALAEAKVRDIGDPDRKSKLQEVISEAANEIKTLRPSR